MSNDDFIPIRPQPAPLTVDKPTNGRENRSARRQANWPLIALAIAAVALIGAVFVVLPDYISPPVVTTHTAMPSETPATPEAGAATEASAATDDDAPPPFAALLREQTREKAQTELARFVELQMQLENEMQVTSWGEAELDVAKGLALDGDEHFVAERFDAALESYRAAADALAELVRMGEERLATALARGQQALDARDEAAARAAFNEALIIDPDNSQAEAGLSRAERLPEVESLLRTARNQELAGDYRAALATYHTIRALDADTHGLEQAIRAAEAGVTEMEFREHLSRGFAALDSGEFETARSAFQDALTIHPDDEVARGGLEQVAEQKDLATIRRLRARAEAHEAAEEWRQAIEAYDEVLALDPTIRFARTGRSRALAQEKTAITLGNIIASPDKLSSSRLYGQAMDILTAAKALEPRGPRLAEQISRVESLLETYGTPVPVVLKSDNETEVILSTVGPLGTFSEKQLNLRPGAYTLIGSRDGCRDIRASILVRPNMDPVEIRCQEPL